MRRGIDRGTGSEAWRRSRLSAAPARSGRRGARLGAFSLLEMLAVISVIAILLAIMLPALSACRRAGRNLKCASQMKSVSFEFQLFADDFAARSRGDGSAASAKWFYVEDFQESLYRVDEYWDISDATRVTYDAPQELMMCPEGPSFLRRLAATPCSGGAVYPRQNVSVAFNRRLHRGPDGTGFPMQIKVLTSRILDHPNVPLALDIDASGLDATESQPYYAAPACASSDGYEGGEYWYPSFRHGLRMNVGMIGGYVATLKRGQPLAGLDWSFVPE